MTAVPLYVRAAAPIALTLGLLAPMQSPASALATHSGSGGWSVVPSPNLPAWDILNGVTASSPSDAWAVGTTHATAFGNSKATPLAEHWDGHTWRVVPVPGGIYSRTNELDGVTSLGSDDVWAVGRSVDTSAPSEPQAALVDHWDGTSWSAAKLPAVTGNPQLGGVAVISPGDVWAVGSHATNQPNPPFFVTLAEHFDGHTWTAVPTPNPGLQDDTIGAVAAAGPNDVWVVGHQTAPGYTSFTLAEHWNGTAWQVVPTPNVAGATSTALSSVAVRSADDVWAAGEYYSRTASGVLLEHWNGKQWSLVATMPGGYALTGMAVTGSQQAWAVGGDVTTLTEQWNGKNWAQVPSPNPGTLQNDLVAVAAIPGTGHLFAVGYQLYSGHPSRTLILMH